MNRLVDLRLVASLSLWTVVGCGEEPAAVGNQQPQCLGASCDGSGAGGDGGVSGPVQDGGAQGHGPTAKSGLPCDVQAVVYKHCIPCHNDPPVSTFMPLLTQADFQAASVTEPERKNYELARERINADKDPMPPVRSSSLSEAERATLDAWFAKGAPASDEACGTNNPALPDAGTDAGPDDDRDATGSELECHRLLAHAPFDKTTKFKVGTVTDGYFSVVYQSPWKEMVYGVVLRPVIDNAQVLHHWILYREPIAGLDGQVTPTSGQHTAAEMIQGWAPGGDALDFRKRGDIGVELPPGTYSMEFHYNSADPNAEDASGVEVCVKRKRPQHIAGLHWLGLDHGAESYITGALVGTWASGNCGSPSAKWVGTCRPQTREPVTLLYVFPHMHEAGVHMKGVINGLNGTRILHDEPFDFSDQVTYEVDDVLMPGETITTTCTYSEPKCSGQATGAEMCYLYTYAYPKGALTDNGIWGRIAHGDNTCLGQ